ncbi:MAG TPA: TonB-dependent receptor [Bacteroidales bacterium]|nr:TonB-dependent receptor [Bacteroidales bacterium]HBZ20872.1 TonB-dependent receptor [Bacteroidales bacterium]
MKKLIKSVTPVIIILFLMTADAIGQSGAIEGTVKDKSNSEALIGTTVQIDGTTNGTTTDINGHFKLLNLKPGKYNLKVSYVSYTARLIENVIVENGRTSNIDIELTGNTVSLGDITVSAIRRTNTEISMITDIKASQFVSTGISGQQISKTLDKDASEVVKRVPGITIMDNRFLIVRGLSQRYNNVWLNNAATPSAEADVKAFSFDIIPSSMIENIMILKSPAAELPADFSGGFVKITTRNLPEKNGLFFSYSTGINGNTTFKEFYKPVSGSTDWLGFDNGSRALPNDMPAHLNEYELATNPSVRDKITTLGRELNNNWSPVRSTAYPDQKFLAGINRKFSIGKHTLGNITAITYSLSNSSEELQNTDYSIYDYSTDKPSYLNQFVDQHFSNSARVAVMNNSSLFLGKGTKIELRNLFNQAGSSRYIIRDGREWYNNGRYVRSEELRYLSRAIYTGQLAGEHSFREGKTKIDWIVGYASSNKREPDTKRYRYLRDETDPDKYMLLFSDQADLSSQSRMWINLKENTLSAMVNFTKQMSFGGFQPEIKAGVYVENKGRTFHARNFGYAKGSAISEFGQTYLPIDQIFTNANINLTNGIKLTEVTALSDSYDAGNNQIAAYLSARIPLGQKINVYAGLRAEKNRQTLASYKQASNTKVNVDRDTINLFPSANIAYNISEKSLLRAAYGMTINRPEFREIAPFYYVDFEQNAGIYGAPHIKQAYIHSLDLRYELYPNSGETFNVGVFYKKFLNPIEQIILGNNPTQYSFENVESAYSMGIEAELRKSLEFIPGMKNITAVLNSSLIKSRVTFPDGSLSRNRPLEGQSPYIVNAGLYYQGENNGMMISLLYNVIGKRIVAVGRPSPNAWEDIPDIYEMPRNVFDLTVSKTIGKRFEIKGGIRDLLNEKAEYMQAINAKVDMTSYSKGEEQGIREFNRKQYTRIYYPGRYFSLGLTVKL